jgi:hypothetical protein
VKIGAEHPPSNEVDELLNRALETTEEALAQVTRLAIQRIRRGTENPPHLDAAERDLRSALRQLATLSRERERAGKSRGDR